MKTPLQQFRDDYLELLLDFLWREWTAIGVAGRERGALGHVVDPEALLLFTCSLGRYDQRLFDEVLDWLTKNGRFLNVQRIKNILGKEDFGGGQVLSAIADWLSKQSDPMKWKQLAKMDRVTSQSESLFYLPDGRPLPQTTQSDAVFLEHGFTRNPVILRGYGQTFSPEETHCLSLRMRALFGLNARCDVLTYLALNGTGHPRQVARELYYSQKAIHDVMTDMACSGVIYSFRAGRERTFRIIPDALALLTGSNAKSGWVNWPVLLSVAEMAWRLADDLSSANLDPLVETSEITLIMKPLFERLARASWGSLFFCSRDDQGITHLRAFTKAFKSIIA